MFLWRWLPRKSQVQVESVLFSVFVVMHSSCAKFSRESRDLAVRGKLHITWKVIQILLDNLPLAASKISETTSL